jgi:phosphonate transport system substrate-binding protein
MIRILAAFLLVLACSAAEFTEFTFGIIATESTQGLKKDWQPVVDDLQTSLGMPVKLFFAPDYSGVIEAMRFNKVQAAWFGNKSAISAVDRAGGEVFAQVVDKDGAAGYWSLIVVNKDSPLNTLDDLLAKGKELTFSMGDPQSTSGTLVPGYHAFGKRGIDPFKYFKVCRNGNHESNALSVANKQVDAATCNTEMTFRLEQEHPEMAAKLKVIWKSDLIASDPLVRRADLPQDIKDRLTGFFANYGSTPASKAKLAPLKYSGFKLSTNNQLLPYRHMSLLKEKSKLDSDDKIDAAAKAAKITELNKQIADLEATMAEVAKLGN